jgi:hypothetical protein
MKTLRLVATAATLAAGAFGWASTSFAATDIGTMQKYCTSHPKSCHGSSGGDGSYYGDIETASGVHVFTCKLGKPCHFSGPMRVIDDNQGHNHDARSPDNSGGGAVGAPSR